MKGGFGGADPLVEGTREGQTLRAVSPNETTPTAARAGRGRAIAFAAVAVVFLVMHFLLSPLPYALLGWFLEGGAISHRVHEVCFGLTFAITATGVLVLLRRPEEKIAPFYQVIVPLYLIILSVLLVDRLVDPVVFAFIVFPILLLVLHPNRRSVLRPETQPRRLLLAAVAIAAVPLLVYAVDQIQEGFRASKLAPEVLEDLPDSATDSEVEAALTEAARTSAELEAIQHFGHWSAMGAFALSIVGLGLVGALGMKGWRLPAWAAAVAMAVFGAASLAAPGDASALSAPWGIAALLWAMGFAVATEIERRRSPSTYREHSASV